MGKRDYGKDIVIRMNFLTHELIQANEHGISITKKVEESIEDMETFNSIFNNRQICDDTTQALCNFTTQELLRIRRNYNVLTKKT